MCRFFIQKMIIIPVYHIFFKNKEIYMLFPWNVIGIALKSHIYSMENPKYI